MEREIENLILKKLTDDISVQEDSQLRSWLESSKENEKEFSGFQKAWEKSRLIWQADHTKESYQKLAENLEFDDTSTNAKIVAWQRSSNIRRVAAVVALLLGISFAIYFFNIQPNASNPELVVSTIVKNIPKGKKLQTRLPDGTKVMLNSGSSLEYPENFREERVVKLAGEAFFEVKRDESRPFIVESKDLAVRVLGTSFNVSAYPKDETISVAVATGIVEVKSKTKTTGSILAQLSPNESINYMRSSGQYSVDEFDDDHFFAWKDGILDFKQADFDEIVEKLERWYGVEIVIETQHHIKSGFSGRYENATLEHVLEGVSFANDFSFSIEGNKVIIK